MASRFSVVRPLLLLAIAEVVGNHVLSAQMVRLPPVMVAPIGTTPVSLVQGGNYVIQVTPSAAPTLTPSIAVPGVTIVGVQSGADGVSRAEIRVAEDAPTGPANMDVGHRSVPIVVVPPEPPGEGKPEADEGEPSDDASSEGSAWWKWALALVVGIGIGATVRRHA
jgi:hypothetical protein